MGDADYLYAFQNIVMPIAYEYAPDLVIGAFDSSALRKNVGPDLRACTVSAGYDAAKGDELGKMNVSPDGYAHMTHMLSALAGGKLLLALEVHPGPTLLCRLSTDTLFWQGGYNVNAIAESAYACVKVIVGDELPVMSSIGAASLAATNTVHDVRRMQAQYWKCMGEALLSQEELSKAGKIESLSGARAFRTCSSSRR